MSFGSRPAPPWLSSRYRPDIDGLRAVSVLAVILFHAFPYDIRSGFVGVDVFFVISGYLIGGLISAELAAGAFSFLAFYARRVRRIFPALIVVMAFTYLVGWHEMYPAEFTALGKHLGAAAVFVVNFVLLNEVGYFDMEAHAKPLLHLWSLAIEEQFYLLWPLFAWLLRGRRSLFLALTVAFCVLSFALNVSTEEKSVAFYSPQTRFWELAVGVLMAHVPNDLWGKLRSERFVREGAVAAGLVLIVLSALEIPAQAFPGWWALMPVVGGALVVGAGPTALVGRYALANRPMVFVGKISYPLYLWHWPLFAFAWLAYGQKPPVMAMYPLIAASFLFAWATYTLVEKPIRFGIRSPRVGLVLAAAVLAIGCGGLLTLSLGGVPSRTVAQVNRSRAEDILVPTDTRTSDGTCEARYGLRTGDAYVCFVNDPAPDMLIIGDSVSMAFYSAIKVGKIPAKSALLATHSFHWREPGCERADSLQVWLTRSATCQAVIRTALDILRRAPTIQAVVLPTYTGNPFFSDPVLLADFQKAVVALGRKLVYVSATPQFSRPPGACWPRQFSLLGVDFSRSPDVVACREDRSAIDPYMEPQRALFSRLAREAPGASVYDSSRMFVDNEYYRQSDDQGALFWSWAHINERGSLRVLRDFLPWLYRTVLKAGPASQ